MEARIARADIGETTRTSSKRRSRASPGTEIPAKTWVCCCARSRVLGCAGDLFARLRLYPALDLGGDGIGELGELGVLVDHVGDHGAHGHDALAVGAGRVQCLLDQDGRQAASAEFGIDLGVVEDALILTVGEFGQADGFALDGDGVLAVLRC